MESTIIDRNSLQKLGDMLNKVTGRLSAIRNISVEEIVAMFLHIV
jgi:hypothetical protein